MPKSTQASAHTENGPADPEASMEPILLRTDRLSRTASAVQLGFHIFWLWLQFPKLVEDPVAGLIETLTILALAQTGWVLVFLPPAGSKEAGNIPAHIVPTLLSLVLTAFSVPILHVFFVLFGAPFLTHVYHTLLCSATLAILSVFPVVYAHGVNSKAWAAVCGAAAPWDEVFCGFWGGIVGAWLGAVPIPLDWDREWQKWPVTIVCGIFGGYAVGRVVGSIMMVHSGVVATKGEGQVQPEGRKGLKKRAKKD